MGLYDCNPHIRHRCTHQTGSNEFLVFLRRGDTKWEYTASRLSTLSLGRTGRFLILCDEHFALPQEARLGGETAFRVGDTIQHNADPVRAVSG